MSNKARINYVVDAVIGLAFILSALSGMVFLFAGSEGYQGGRNPGFQTDVLSISRWTWRDLHTWTSLVMMAGILGHLLLHWNWIICMTKRLLLPVKVRPQEACPVD